MKYPLCRQPKLKISLYFNKFIKRDSFDFSTKIFLTILRLNESKISKIKEGIRICYAFYFSSQRCIVVNERIVSFIINTDSID